MDDVHLRGSRWDDVAQQIRAKTLDADLLRQHMLLYGPQAHPCPLRRKRRD